MAPSALKNLSKSRSMTALLKGLVQTEWAQCSQVLKFKASQLMGDGLLTHPTTIAQNSH